MPAVKTKRGKENTASKPKKVVEVDPLDELDDTPVDEPEPVKPKGKVGRPLKQTKRQAEAEPDVETDEPPRAAASTSKGDGGLQRQLAAMTAERDRAIKERDAFAKQFEDLSRLRQTEPEALLAKFKEQTAAVAKAQADVIENQTALNDKWTAKVTELEKALAASKAAAESAEEKAAAAAAPPVLEGKLDGKNSVELRNEVFKLRSTLKEKEEQFTTLQTDYAAEVAHSRKLQEARPSIAIPTAPPAATSEEQEKDQKSLGIYEDVTGLAILNVRIKSGSSGKDISYNCLQTVEDRTFGFRLRSFNEADRATKTWKKMIELTPEGLHNEKDKAFVARLGPFAQGFTIPREQIQGAWDQLRARLSKDGVFEEPQGQ